MNNLLNPFCFVLSDKKSLKMIAGMAEGSRKIFDT